MKKVVIGIVLVIVVLIIINQIYCFSIMNKVYEAIINFRDEENRYYSVVIKNNDEIFRKEEILLRNHILKCNEIKDGENVYCEWEDSITAQSYSIDLKNKSFIENDALLQEQKLMKNLPSVILETYQDGKFQIREFLKIKCIFPSKYENQECYKLVTSGKVLIISKDTYLPIYYSVKTNNLKEDFKNNVENIYEFKVGEVTEEEVSLPDLTDYTNNREE